MWREFDAEHDTYGEKMDSSCRRDFTGGLFYSGRREYLYDFDNGIQKNILEPPDEFKSKEQLRNALKIKNSGGIDYSKISESVKKVSEEVLDHQNGKNIVLTKKERAKGKEIAARKNEKQFKNVIIERYSTLDPAAWAEVVQAGVRMWINEKTGEVSDICPWLDGGNDYSLSTAPSNNISHNYSNSDDTIDALATDDSPFSSPELAELIAILDKQKASKA